MKCQKPVFLVLLLCLCSQLTAQTGVITGHVFDENNVPLSQVNISSANSGTFSDSNGHYILQLAAERKDTITFSHIGHKNVVLNGLILNTNETYEFNPVLKTDITQMDDVTISATGEKIAGKITEISLGTIQSIPGANPGVENILMLLPGVSSNNELSTQYTVRGGNYDENLVYVNEIEVYRPFLIRSGQQEGLSFINSDLIQNVAFSSGGFQAKYGDKLSSVLDVTYKKPTQFGARVDLGLLGASLALETISKNKKLSSITGIRYRNNSLLLNSKQTQANYRPIFTDIQSYFTYRASNKLHFNFLGNISVNNYQNKPFSRQTNFGTILEPKALVVYFDGSEKNRYQNALGAIKTNYYLNDNFTLKFISSIYHATEEEYSDVIAQYKLGEIDTDPTSGNIGEVTTTRGIGSQYTFANNDLDALIFNLEQKGKYAKNNKSLEWGIKYTHEDIRDQLQESKFIDSQDYLLRPPIRQFAYNLPGMPFNAPLEPYQGINARNSVKTNRLSGFAQFSEHSTWNENDIYYNFGLRYQRWTVSGVNVEQVTHEILSPRGQFVIKPNWKSDMLFRLSAGIYYQPPFYRELRDSNGTINPWVKAQRSTHFVLGNEYSFLLWKRPFNLKGEVYYKKLDNVNPYTIEDVRIRYSANNNAKAYAYGAEIRMNGAFVPGTESWVSLGFLKTEENIDGKGFIPRPTDQRFKLGILFQDYVPDIPNLKMFLNLVYNKGVPGGSPSYADPYIFQSRLRDYKRADLGISHIFVNAERKYPKDHWLHKFKELSVGFEIFNLFNNQNSITNTWVRDVDSNQEFAIPNFMTSRVLNIRLKMRF